MSQDYSYICMKNVFEPFVSIRNVFKKLLHNKFHNYYMQDKCLKNDFETLGDMFLFVFFLLNSQVCIKIFNIKNVECIISAYTAIFFL